MFFKVTFILAVALIAITDGRKKKNAVDVVAIVDDLSAIGGQPCSLNIKKYLTEDREPLMLEVQKVSLRDSHEVQRLDIARPQTVDGIDGVIKVDSNEELMAVCTGKKNTVADSGEESVSLKCVDGNLLLPDGSEVTPESLACSESVAYSWLKLTKEGCGVDDNKGVIVQLGFQMKDGSWFPEVDLCHNITLGHTYWAGHSVYGRSIRGSVKSSKRRPFSRGSKRLYPGIRPDLLYTQESQKKVLNQTLGQSQSAKYLKNTFLARGHLAPDADFIFMSEQLLTYYFANAAPQWQTFNAGNWLTLENTVRDLAAKTKVTLNVYTGTFGVLNLTDTSDKQRSIYLEPNKKMIPVPEVFWKVVQHPVTHSCTVAVGHNNVFLKEAPKALCTKSLPDGWPKKDLGSFHLGYSYYCDYQSFSKVVKFGPDLECKDLFEFPEILS